MIFRLLVATFGLLAIARATPPDPAYTLAWSDEFNGTAVDPSLWDYRTDSKHWSTQLPANLSVKDGFLYLNLKKEKSGGKEYTGAGVISKRLFKFGYYESRFKVPPTKGWHTSFWMQRHDGSGGTDPRVAVQELDVCENDSGNLTRYGTNTHRYRPDHAQIGQKNVATPDLSADFHVWGCEFTAEKIIYYFDGKVVQTTETAKLGEPGEMHLWLTSIASHLGPTDRVDDSRLPVQAVFDYVRFYTKK
jgi:beta-glucanase (GH16 family)